MTTSAAELPRDASGTSPAVLSGVLREGDLRLLKGQIWLGLTAFGIGILQGLAQALDRVLPANHTLWRLYPLQQNYYQGLTNHGVLLVLVFTFAFSR